MKYVDFVHQLGFPNVIGCIDGTQVQISSPKENEPKFHQQEGLSLIKHAAKN